MRRRGLWVLLLATPLIAEDHRPPAGTGAVRGQVIGKDGTLLGVDVRVLVDGREVATSRTDINGRYRLRAPAGEFELEAVPAWWTELPPVRRRITMAPGTAILEDFILGGSAGASGHFQGASGDETLTLFAIRAADFPESMSVEDLQRAPKIVVKARGAFTFPGLEPRVAYRIAVDGYGWGLARPVVLRAGDEAADLFSD